VLDKVREKFNCRFIVDGANISDLGEHRPGIEAFSSCGVIHPFIMAGITKQEIREIAKETGLSFWNKPSSACLYSRIPYGDNISDEKLIMIEKGEDILSDLGITQVRVRHHGNIARIEVIPGEMDIVYNARDQIQDAFKKIGFLYTTLDLRGYRPGSMDEPLKE
jgi:pyridinium-3,5-biscarboxylic acid mononucleotide sulfurtransferase